MRRGILFTFMSSCVLLAGCGDSGVVEGSGSGSETVAEGGTAETSSNDEVGTSATTTGDGDTTTTTTTGDGDTTTTTGDTGTTDTGDTGMMDTTDTGDTGDLCGTTLYSTVRDFQVAHPDFEYAIGVDPGIVEADLGGDQKPVYAGDPVTPTTTGVDNFNQWYNDVDGVNMPFEVPIELVEIQPGLYQYANTDFFPIDDQGWGNEGNVHNYHFTLELHSKFQYQGGEVFGFEGDDDLWVFVNGKLGIDLGGVHGPLSGNIDMDAMAGQLGLQIGGVYDLDFFFAERHTTQSNFTITTSIACFNPQ